MKIILTLTLMVLLFGGCEMLPTGPSSHKDIELGCPRIPDNVDANGNHIYELHIACTQRAENL